MVEVANPSPSASNLLGVFARYWQPGQVKTRLASRIGDASAARLHRQFVEATLLRLQGLGGEHWLAVSPAESSSRAAGECQAAVGWHLCGQSEGPLGTRMNDFFTSAFAVAERVVLIGSDSPDLPRQFIEQAFAALDSAPVVLGPASDGGYYSIGLRAELEENCRAAALFRDVPWSTPKVLSLTLDRLKNAGIAYHLLPTWHDVDEWDDLVALHQRLRQPDAVRDPSLQELRSAVAAEVAKLQVRAPAESRNG